jgi:ABC-2 type transport system ATP-binding protein
VNVLTATGLTKRYDEVEALAGFSLEVADGEIVGLVGHNGAGKTTFVDVVSGLLRPDGGTALVNGKPPHEVRGQIGICPQHIALYRPMTVREHLELYGVLGGFRGRALRAQIDELDGQLMLTSFLNRPTGLLSGGQQRRAQAACALIHRPSLLLMDEPTAGADPETREALLQVVKRRAADGAAVVYTTHYLNELAVLDATIAVASHGRVIARGSSADLLGELPGVVSVTAGGNEVRVSTTDSTSTLLALLKDIERPVEDVELRKPTLDDLYHALAVTHD